MNLNQYTFAGEPERLKAAWERALEGFSKEDHFLHLVSTREDALIVLDLCPTEADFQGWINGADWRRIKAEIGGDVVVTRLGELQSGIVREGVVEVVHASAHSH